MTLVLAVVIGAGPALAEPTAEEEEAARAAGNSAAAEFTCDTVLPVGSGDLQERCVSAIQGVVAKAPSFEDIQPQLMCTAVAPLGPLVTGGCLALVTANVGGIRDAAQSAYDATIGQVADVAGGVIDTAGKVKSFVEDPQGQFEELVNTLKESAVDFLNQVMGQLVNIGNPDFTAEWWRNAYAASGGIGMVVAAIMMCLVLRDAARDRISASQFGESIQYLVGGIISMVWAPVMAYVVQNLITALNKGIVAWAGEDIYETVLDGAIFSVTAPMMPGGIIMGLVFWLLLFLGAFSVFVMFIAQGMAVLLTSLSMAIAFGMLAHPRWRAKALRVPSLVLGIMLSKPALLFVMSALFMMIQNFNPLDFVGADALQTLGEGCMIVLALFLIGLAPWAAFKFIPLLPDGSEVDGGGFNPASAAAGAAGGMMTTMAMQKMRSGGGGGGGKADPSHGASSSTIQAAPQAPGAGDVAPKLSAGGGGASGGAGGAAGLAGKAGAAGGGGGGAAGAAGTAAGGAASGGALLVAAAAAKTAGAGAGAARSAAESATPGQQGDTGEEQQSSVHDHRKGS